MLPQNIYCLKPLALICSLLSLKVVFSTHKLNLSVNFSINHCILLIFGSWLKSENCDMTLVSLTKTPPETGQKQHKFKPKIAYQNKNRQCLQLKS